MTKDRSTWLQGRLASVGHARAGLRLLLATQKNARIHALATVLVLGCGWGLGVSAGEWCLLVLALVAVWAAEAFNTALELLTDLTSPEWHPLAGKAKDVASAAVFISAFGAALVGALVFGPHLLEALG